MQRGCKTCQLIPFSNVFSGGLHLVPSTLSPLFVTKPIDGIDLNPVRNQDCSPSMSWVQAVRWGYQHGPALQAIIYPCRYTKHSHAGVTGAVGLSKTPSPCSGIILDFQGYRWEQFLIIHIWKNLHKTSDSLSTRNQGAEFLWICIPMPGLSLGPLISTEFTTQPFS